jgi:cytochrome c biogenesis protein CcmG, thiol:disulfide interchange protein DsbE
MRGAAVFAVLCTLGCSTGMGLGMGGGSGGSMFGMSSTTGGGGMGGAGANPPPQAPPTDPLSFMEWPTGLWWSQTDDRGHVVVLSSWGTSCRACVEALPQLESLGRQFAGRGVHVYAINIEPDPTRFPGLLKTLPAYPAILVDPSGQRLAVVLGMGSIPTTWVLTGDGKVAWVQEGWDNNIAAALSAKLRALVGGGT